MLSMALRNVAPLAALQSVMSQQVSSISCNFKAPAVGCGWKKSVFKSLNLQRRLQQQFFCPTGFNAGLTFELLTKEMSLSQWAQLFFLHVTLCYSITML